jgi:hypothetical protein
MRKLLLLLIFVSAQFARGQTTNAPKTYFELAFHEIDTPLIRGMAVVPAPDSLFLAVRVEKLTTTAPGARPVYAISLRGRAGNYTDVDYIDDDEIDGLIRGIRLISQAGHSITTMDDFEVAYRTRSGFSISKTSSGNNAVIIVKSGRDDGQRVQVETYMLNDLANAIASAKAKLDTLR